MGETGDDGLDKNPCTVGRCLHHKALIIVITWILPLGLDSYSVTDFKVFDDASRDECVAIHGAKNMGKFDHGNNQKSELCAHQIQLFLIMLRHSRTSVCSDRTISDLGRGLASLDKRSLACWYSSEGKT
jgi:hypothetical protein